MARKPQGCTRSSIQRWLIGGVTGLSLVTQLAALGHLVLVRHTTCPEHGELVHADHADVAHAGRSGRSASASPQMQLSSRDQTSLESDEHCDVLAHRREYVDPPVFAALIAPLATEPPAAFPAPCVLRADADPIYARAPKTSPPSA